MSQKQASVLSKLLFQGFCWINQTYLLANSGVHYPVGLEYV